MSTLSNVDVGEPAASAVRARSARAHRVVVVGGGFGGLRAVRGLRRAPVEVTLVDRRNFHLFQPLLYQVATGVLAAGEIASPLRGILKRQRNAKVVLGEVLGFDLERRRVLLEGSALDYDTLVVAAGAEHAYFGHDDWRPLAPGLKTVEEALAIRARILGAFEAAELEPDPELRGAWLTFVVVGGGPTGVELAGQIAEIARDTLRRDFRNVDPRAARIALVEAAPRVLTDFPERLSARAAAALERLGVTAALDRVVVDVDPDAVTVEAPGGERERIATRTPVWAAGVRASGLAGRLAEASGTAVDRAGRVAVGPNLTVPGHPEVFAIGDMARVLDAEGRELSLPGVAPAAMQQGRHAAKAIRKRLAGREQRGFRYVDKGNVATIGRLRAVLDLRGVRLSGVIAWLGYLFVHLFYLVGLQNRLLVLIRWTVGFLTRARGARLITADRPDATGDRGGAAVTRERALSPSRRPPRPRTSAPVSWSTRFGTR
jgi:NADH:ubiquinone reductase (H+-translocating)